MPGRAPSTARAPTARAHWPHTMLATSTHDNKRSEDVRARIDVLSEMPAAWRLQLRRWARMNRGAQARASTARAAPSPQRRVPALPDAARQLPAEALPARRSAAYRERIAAYMLKAAREAKRARSWVNADDELRGGAARLRARRCSAERPDNPSSRTCARRSRAFAWFGVLNSLSMTLLKLASPGVPDIYQGNETGDLTLVDPDNRRPVDYARRARCLDALAARCDRAGVPRALLATPHDGRAKLWIIWRLLALRRERRGAVSRRRLPCR